MACVTCFGVAEMVIDEWSKKLGDGYTVVSVAKTGLEAMCSLIDKFIESFGGTSYEVDVEEETNYIVITIECEDFELQSKDELFGIIRISKSFSVKPSKVNEDGIVIQFKFGTLWVPKD